MFKKRKLLPLKNLIWDRWAKWSFFVSNRTFLLYIDNPSPPQVPGFKQDGGKPDPELLVPVTFICSINFFSNCLTQSISVQNCHVDNLLPLNFKRLMNRFSAVGRLQYQLHWSAFGAEMLTRPPTRIWKRTWTRARPWKRTWIRARSLTFIIQLVKKFPSQKARKERMTPVSLMLPSDQFGE